MLDWVANAIETLHYWGIALLMFLENIFPPLPSEIIMPLAGYTAAQGRLSFWGVVIAGIIGATTGQLPLYFVARTVGEQRLRRWVEQHGKWLTLSGSDLDRAQHWFDTYGGRAVFIARLVPGLRSLITIPAGLARMDLLKFLLYSTPGIAIWTFILAGLGHLLGENYGAVEQYLSPVAYVVIGGLLLGFGAWIIKRKRNQREEQSEPETGSQRRDQRSARKLEHK